MCNVEQPSPPPSQARPHSYFLRLGLKIIPRQVPRSRALIHPIATLVTMNLVKGLWACIKGILIVARHVDELPTDDQLRAAGIEPYQNTGVPPWAFRGLNRHR